MFHHQHWREPGHSSHEGHGPAYMTPAYTATGRRDGAHLLSGYSNPSHTHVHENDHDHDQRESAPHPASQYIIDRGYEQDQHQGDYAHHNHSHIHHNTPEAQETTVHRRPHCQSVKNEEDDDIDEKDARIASLSDELNRSNQRLVSLQESLFSTRGHLEITQGELDTAQGIIKSLEVAKGELEEKCNLLADDKTWLEQSCRNMAERVKTLMDCNESLEEKCKRKKERVTILEHAMGQMIDEMLKGSHGGDGNVSWLYYSGTRGAREN